MQNLQKQKDTLYHKGIAYNRGKFGEKLVAHYLLCKNFIILEKNYNCKFAEVDIICCKGNTLIFVEVKSWHYSAAYEIATVVNARKIDKIRKCAEFFLTNFIEYAWTCARIDVILVQVSRHIMIHYKGV